jgi:hypothetical protein
MALPAILNENDRIFGFEHAMAHRNVLAAMAPLNGYSVVPYILDPMQHTDQPATKWFQNHQQAHNDGLTALPQAFGLTILTIRPGQNLIDQDWADQRQKRWWTFANHMDHMAMEASIQEPFILTLPAW